MDGGSKFWLGKDYVNFIFKDFVDLDDPFDGEFSPHNKGNSHPTMQCDITATLVNENFKMHPLDSPPNAQRDELILPTLS